MAIDLTVIKNSITRDSCTIWYQTDEPGISYSWNWSPSATNVTTGSSGEAIITGLVPGALNTILTTLTVTIATETGSTTRPPINGSISVYTQPAKWEWKGGGLIPDDFIFDYITASKWNEELLNKLKEYLEWSNQKHSSLNYSDLQILQNEVISAKKFNAVAEKCGVKTVRGKEDNYPGDLITADIFNKLAQGVSGEL